MEIIFDRRLIALDQNITSASQAIELSGTLLARQQICRPEYITAMLDVYKDFGPAIVIDSGLAMPHARPEKGAIRTGFSLITIRQPLHFGHEEFDPVSVIIGIAGADADNHIKMIQIIAALIESDIVSFLREEHDINAVFNFIHNKMESSLC